MKTSIRFYIGIVFMLGPVMTFIMSFSFEKREILCHTLLNSIANPDTLQKYWGKPNSITNLPDSNVIHYKHFFFTRKQVLDTSIIFDSVFVRYDVIKKSRRVLIGEIDASVSKEQVKSVRNFIAYRMGPPHIAYLNSNAVNYTFSNKKSIIVLSDFSSFGMLSIKVKTTRKTRK